MLLNMYIILASRIQLLVDLLELEAFKLERLTMNSDQKQEVELIVGVRT